MNKQAHSNKIRVFICDDSSLVRILLRDLLESDNDIEVIGEAENGKKAVEQVLALKPDVVTMDLEMPVMGGHEAIQQIMAVYGVPILVVSSLDDAENAYKAISNGALDIIGKPQLDILEIEGFTKKVKMLSTIKVVKHLNLTSKLIQPEKLNQQAIQAQVLPETTANVPTSSEPLGRIVAIASSTGGPQALEVILKALPANFSYPIVISQHMSKGFSQGLADWLDSCVSLKVKLATDFELLQAGVVYVSPSEQHLSVTEDRRVRLCDTADSKIYHPNCDLLLKSVASVYGDKAIAVICTGMGSDGAAGMQSIKAAGGITIAQDEASSVIFGMNQVAISRNCIDQVLAIDVISGKILSLCGSRS